MSAKNVQRLSWSGGVRSEAGERKKIGATRVLKLSGFHTIMNITLRFFLLLLLSSLL